MIINVHYNDLHHYIFLRFLCMFDLCSLQPNCNCSIKSSKTVILSTEFVLQFCILLLADSVSNKNKHRCGFKTNYLYPLETSTLNYNQPICIYKLEFLFNRSLTVKINETGWALVDFIFQTLIYDFWPR